ncbi:fibronectin type III domain-containing protein [Winogradskyella sp. F6397]|uniref:Fibronectin type III domain-containing protein n=1 Tax=Winogradskyella marina TaxID=2785530 RepID=A0ABS0EHS3_9FLAO|nr:lipocalin family protein [Winogradskyella marina]MBF8149127.1 fibronectin type III domain-containing protein [Winogradskyella marina]
MKTYQNISRTLLILMLIGLVSSCSSDDDNITNKAPNNFNVVDVANAADLQLQLSWEASTDPEGDAISYQVYLDTQNPPQMEIANNLNTTTYNIQTDLQPETTYYWTVIAKDANGNTTQSNIDSFTTRELTTGEILIGEWYFESQAGAPPFSECKKNAFINFTEDLFFQVTNYDEDTNGNCVLMNSENGTYQVIDRFQFEVTLNGTTTIWDIQSISSTELVVNIDGTILTFIKA